jgi:hypothetical protein
LFFTIHAVCACAAAASSAFITSGLAPTLARSVLMNRSTSALAASEHACVVTGTVVVVVVGFTVVVVVGLTVVVGGVDGGAVEPTPASEIGLLQPPNTPFTLRRARYTVVGLPSLSYRNEFFSGRLITSHLAKCAASGPRSIWSCMSWA